MSHLCCPHCREEVFASDIVEFNGVRVDGSRYVAKPDGGLLKLAGNYEVRLLTALMLARGRTVTKDALYTALYGLRPECDQPGDQILPVLVCKLRRQMKKGGVPLIVDTDWGRGWRLVAGGAV